jgi:hypothetical protein
MTDYRVIVAARAKHTAVTATPIEKPAMTL